MGGPRRLDGPLLAYGALTITKYGEIEGIGREIQEAQPCPHGEAPHPGCECGIPMDYRFKTIEHDRYRDRLGYRLVTVGVYELWGRIVFRGARVFAQYARLAAIYQFQDDSPERRSLIAVRAQTDGIPVLTRASGNKAELESLQLLPLASTSRRWSAPPNSLLRDIWTSGTYDFGAGFLGPIRLITGLFLGAAVFILVLEVSGNASLAALLAIALLVISKVTLARLHSSAIVDPPADIDTTDPLPNPKKSEYREEHHEEKSDLAKEMGLSE